MTELSKLDLDLAENVSVPDLLDNLHLHVDLHSFTTDSSDAVKSANSVMFVPH